MLSFPISKTKLLQVLLLIVSPFLSLILALFFLVWRNKVNMLALSISLASLFIYLPLAPDTVTNFSTYLSFSDSETLLFSRGVYLASIKYLNEFSGLQFMTVTFLFLVFILFSWFKVFEFFAKQTINFSSYSYMLLFVIFSIIELRMVGLNKNYLAIALFYFFIFLKEIKHLKGIVPFLLFTFSILIHPSVVLIVILYFIAKVLKSIKIYIWIILLSFIGSFLFFPFLEYMSKLLLLLNNQILSYTLDYYIHSPVHGHIHMFGFYLKIRVIEVPFFLIVSYMGIQLMKEHNSVVIRMTLLLIAVTLLFLFMHALYERYSIALYMFSSFIVYEYIVKIGVKNIIMPLLSLLLIVRFLYLNMFNYGYIYFDKEYIKVLPNQNKKIEMIVKPVYMPLLLLLDIENNGYSDKYIPSVSQFTGELSH